MRALTGAVLILAGEQAFSHALLIGFPYQSFAQTILLPVAALCGLTGVILLAWGCVADRKVT